MFATTDHNWSHALIVPFISLYYIYQHRDQLAAVPLRPGVWGLPILLFGLFGYAFGIYPVRNDMAQGYSMIIALFGLIWWLLGPRAMRVLWFPIAYLLFAVKISDRLWDPLAWQLQQVAAQGATIMLKCCTVFFDFDVTKHGTTIDILLMRHGHWTTESLNIAEACSGLRMLMTFVALAVAVAFVWERAWWQRITLLVMAVPVAVAVNIGRVTVMGLVTLVNPDLIHGEMHTYIGIAMLLPAGILFWLLGWIMDRLFIADHGKDNANPQQNAAFERRTAARPTAPAAFPLDADADTHAPTSHRITKMLSGAVVGLLVVFVAIATYGGMLTLSAPKVELPGVPLLITGAVMKLLWTLLPPAAVGVIVAVLWRFYRQRKHDSGRSPHFSSLPAYGFAAAVLLVMTISQQVVIATTKAVLIKQPVPLRHPLLSVPEHAGPWTLEQVDPPLTPEQLQTLGTDSYLGRIYRDTSLPANTPGAQARLHVAYYTGTPDTVPHVPDRCFLAAGMQGIGKDQTTLTLSPDVWHKAEHGDHNVNYIAPAQLEPSVHLPQREIKATRFTFASPQSPERKQYVLYFFIANGRVLANPDMVRLHGFEPQDRYSYYCKIEIQLFDVPDGDAARRRAASLLSHLLPEVLACLPDWQEVRRGDWPRPASDNPASARPASESPPHYEP